MANPAAAQRVGGDDAPFTSSSITSVATPSGRGYRLEAAITGLYDDNLLRIADNEPLNGRDKADLRLSPSVSGSLGYPVGRQQLFVGALFGRDYYVNNSNRDRNRIVVGGGVNWRLGTSCTGSVAGEFRKRQNLFTDEASLSVNNVQENYTYGATGTCQAPVGVGFGGSVLRNEIRNQNPLRAGFNSNNLSFSPQLSYGSSGLGRFSVGGSYTKVDYPDRQVVLPSGAFDNDGVNIISGRLGYSRSLGVRLSASLGVSYNNVKPQPRDVVQFVNIGGFLFPTLDTRRGYSGLGYDISVNYSAGPRLTAQVSGSRNVTSTANVGATYVINTSIGLDLGYKLSPSITTGVGATYFDRSYRGGFPSAVEQVARISDKTSRFYARASYSPVKLYDLDFEVAHQKRDSNPSAFSFSGNSATLTLRVHFGRG